MIGVSGYGGGSLPSGESKFLSDAMRCDSVRLVSSGFEESLNRLPERLTPELERLVVYGDEEFRPGVVAHLPCLFRGAVISDIRSVGADWHDGEIDRPGTV